MDLKTADGRAVHAATGGAAFDAARPAVLFVHGAGMDHTVWALQARSFAHHGHAVLAVDLPGHGGSNGPAIESVDAMGAWLWQVCDAAGVATAALVGHSMGALACLEAAAQKPSRARALVMIGASAEMPVNDSLLDAARDDPDLAVRFIVSWAYGGRGQLGGMRAPGLWMLGGGQSLLKRAPAGVLHNDFAACNAYTGGQAAAGRIACPALVVTGDDDRMTPPQAGRALAAAIPGARFAAIAGAGHMPMLEQPDATLDTLRAFL